MREITLVLLVATLVCVGSAAAAIAPPTAVSPGDSDSFASVGERWPTFNWGAVDGAETFQLVVYAVTDAATAEEVLKVEIPGRATGWTPPADTELMPGRRYAWSVRALDADGPTEWSTPMLFEIRDGVDVGPGNDGDQAPTAVTFVPAARSAAGDDPRSARRRPPAGSTAIDDSAAAATVTELIAAIWGEQGDASGNTAGAYGVSSSPDGAGVVAENAAEATSDGSDLRLVGDPSADINEASFSRESESGVAFDFTNSGAGTMTLQVDGVDVLTMTHAAEPDAHIDHDPLEESNEITAAIALQAATDEAKYVDVTGDTMTGALAIAGAGLSVADDVTLESGETISNSTDEVVTISDGSDSLDIDLSASVHLAASPASGHFVISGADGEPGTSIDVTAGSATAASNADGGDITLTPGAGDGDGSGGVVNVAGDLTVAGVISGDGSGITNITATVDDADLFDGLDSTRFLRSDTSDAFTLGTLTLATGTTLDVDGALQLPATGISGAGAGSGLDADLFDGFDINAFAPASGSGAYVDVAGDTMFGILNMNAYPIINIGGFLGTAAFTNFGGLNLGSDLRLANQETISNHINDVITLSDGTDTLDFDLSASVRIVATPLSGGDFSIVAAKGAGTSINILASSGPDPGPPSAEGESGAAPISKGGGGAINLRAGDGFLTRHAPPGDYGGNADLPVAVGGDINLEAGDIGGNINLHPGAGDNGDAGAVNVWSDLYVDHDVQVSGGVSADSFSGDGSAITNISAQTLDGIDSTEFLRSNTSDDFTTGTLTTAAGTTLDVDGSLSAGGATAVSLPTTALSISGAGAGSGLDADKLDGSDSSFFMPASTDNWVDANGDTMSGDLDMDGNLVINIGDAGTDFVAGGGLNLAGSLGLASGETISNTTNQVFRFMDDDDSDRFDIDLSGSVALVSGDGVIDVPGTLRTINDNATSFRLRGVCDGAEDDNVFDSTCQSYAGIFYNAVFDDTGGNGSRTTRAIIGSNEDMDLEIQGSNHIRITAIDGNVGNGRIRMAAEDEVQVHVGGGAEIDALIATFNGNGLSLTEGASFSGDGSGLVGLSADTATALAANGDNCETGNAPLGVNASGAVEGCFNVATQLELDAQATANAGAYVNVTGDTMTGALTISGGGLDVSATAGIKLENDETVTNATDEVIRFSDGADTFDIDLSHSVRLAAAPAQGDFSITGADGLSGTSISIVAGDGSQGSGGNIILSPGVALPQQGFAETNGAGSDGVVTVQGDLNVEGNLSLSAGTINGNVSGDLTGNVTGDVTGDVTGNLTGNVTGNASTASALAADGANCTTGQFAAGVDAAGAAQGCAAPPVQSHDLNNFNTGVGNQVLVSNTTGSFNTGVGAAALRSNTTGNLNTATGRSALFFNTTGYHNTATGGSALQKNTTGYFNTASGTGALQNNTTGSYNTGSGRAALQSNTTGKWNTASGDSALQNNTTGGSNTASGAFALFSNIIGNSNTASGASALRNNTTGGLNVATGNGALQNNTTGGYNTASGRQALLNNSTGFSNVALGHRAGYKATTGSSNIFIANQGVAGDDKKIKIGTQGTQTATYVAGISGTSLTGSSVVVTEAGQLGVASGATGNADKVDGFDASATATANTLLALDEDMKLPADITGNAATATLAAAAGALSADGGNCAQGQWAAGVDAAGVAEGCTADDDVPTVTMQNCAAASTCTCDSGVLVGGGADCGTNAILKSLPSSTTSWSASCANGEPLPDISILCVGVTAPEV